MKNDFKPTASLGREHHNIYTKELGVSVKGDIDEVKKKLEETLKE